MNLIVAESVNLILDEIESRLQSEKCAPEELLQAIMPVLQKYLQSSKGIRFAGDNYSEAWIKEAHHRGLSNFKKSPESFKALIDPQTLKIFEDILTPYELISRHDILMEMYALNMNIEANLIGEIFRTQILPAAVEYQGVLAASFLQVKEALSPHQFHSTKQALYLKHYNDAIEECMPAGRAGATGPG